MTTLTALLEKAAMLADLSTQLVHGLQNHTTEASHSQDDPDVLQFWEDPSTRCAIEHLSDNQEHLTEALHTAERMLVMVLTNGDTISKAIDKVFTFPAPLPVFSDLRFGICAATQALSTIAAFKNPGVAFTQHERIAVLGLAINILEIRLLEVTP